MLQLFSSFNAQELFFHFNTIQDGFDGEALSDGGVEDRGSKLDDRILKPAPLASCQHHNGRLSQLRGTRHDNRPWVGGFGEGSRWESSRES
jgi:hypothetical protein